MRSLLIILFVFYSFVFNVHASKLDFINKTKKIRVAIDSTYPPMEFEGDDGKPAGLDIDLAKELARKLNVQVEFVIMPWDGILAGLTSNRYDVIMSSMNITKERQQQVNFVEYLKMGQVFVAKKNASKILSEKDLAGKVVAVQADTTSYTAVENFIKNGIKIKEIKAFKGATETFSALKANQAQVIVIDEAVGHYYASLDSKTFSVTGEALRPEPIGIAISKGDEKLLKAIETNIKKMKEDGTFNSIYKKWLKVDPRL